MAPIDNYLSNVCVNSYFNICVNSYFKLNVHNYGNCPKKYFSTMTGISQSVLNSLQFNSIVRDDKNLGRPVVHV